jgi:CheY-like chemotaxis protein
MQMPGMDGLMLATEIRRVPTVAAMPIVLLTSMGVKADSPEFAAASFASCLTKPIKPTQLLEVLVRAISGAKLSTKKTTAPGKLDPGLAARLPLRVLLCDDNAINQKVAARLLQQMGYKPDIAANGREALQKLDEQRYDVVFMDVMMPEMDGLEATREIRVREEQGAQHPNYQPPLVIVAMTASAMQGDRDKCIDAGMDDYLAKPVRPEDVRGIIERWGNAIASSQTAKDKPAAPLAAAAEPGGKPPVDMERLRELTDGTEAGVRELVKLYIDQTTTQLRELETAIRAGQAVEVRRLAHSCAGASATCGMGGIVPLMREMEKQGFEAKLTTAAGLYADAAREFDRICAFLATYSSPNDETAARIPE